VQRELTRRLPKIGHILPSPGGAMTRRAGRRSSPAAPPVAASPRNCSPPRKRPDRSRSCSTRSSTSPKQPPANAASCTSRRPRDADPDLMAALVYTRLKDHPRETYFATSGALIVGRIDCISARPGSEQWSWGMNLDIGGLPFRRGGVAEDRRARSPPSMRPGATGRSGRACAISTPSNREDQAVGDACPSVRSTISGGTPKRTATLLTPRPPDTIK
jgi:hypothetical protein